MTESPLYVNTLGIPGLRRCDAARLAVDDLAAVGADDVSDVVAVIFRASSHAAKAVVFAFGNALSSGLAFGPNR